MNVAGVLERSAARLPDKPALLFRGEPTTYQHLDGRAARGAGALRSLGLAPGSGGAPGDRVAILVGNEPAFVEAFFATLRAGLVAVPLNTGFTRDELLPILRDCGARALVAGAGFAPMVEGVREQVDELDHVVAVGAEGEGTASWHALVTDAEPLDTADAEDDALAVLPYTSGTTGKPRGVMLTHGNLLANHRQVAGSRLHIEERDVVLCVLPLFHIYGLNVVMGFSLSRGATLLLVERFEPASTLEEVERSRGSVLVGAPPMYVAWNGLANLGDVDLASVRYAVSGAAPLPAAVLEEFTERTGVAVWEGYGLTETAPVVTTTAMGDRPKPGSVGRALPGVEVRLVDDGTPVRRGDPGEVCVRGPNVFAGYWNDPEGTAEVLDDEGWFATGDVGYADDEGDLHLVDRKRDLIIVSGFNVYPREVEEALVRHPGVAQAAAVGVAHPATGEAVKAFCVPAGGERPTADEIIAFARERLARFKTPVEVEFVDALPLLASGKVRRVDLRDA